MTTVKAPWMFFGESQSIPRRVGFLSFLGAGLPSDMKPFRSSPFTVRSLPLPADGSRCAKVSCHFSGVMSLPHNMARIWHRVPSLRLGMRGSSTPLMSTKEWPESPEAHMVHQPKSSLVIISFHALQQKRSITGK